MRLAAAVLLSALVLLTSLHAGRTIRPAEAARAATALRAAAPSRSGPFAIGVMRRDGLLIPLAAFDGKRWSSNWPAPQSDLQVPVSVASVPKSWWGPLPAVSDWQVWTGSSPSTAHVTQPDWVDAHCLRQIALRTDYRSDRPEPPPGERPYPKDGLAISPPQRIEAIELLGSSAAGTPGLLRQFNEAEREIESRGFSHPFSRRARETAEPIVEAVYAYGANPRAYYVEASRMYRRIGDNGCTAIAFGTGWFIDAGARKSWVDMAVDLLPCTKYGATYMLPLGALAVSGRTFWVVQYSGWDHERYVIAEITNKAVEAAVVRFGGAC